MGTDPFSPLAPARVRVLVLPFGKITHRRFKAFTARLQQVSAVRLGDITPDSRPGRGTFSPLAFPDGHVHLDVCNVAPPATNGDLAAYEPFRSTMVVLGTIDACEYSLSLAQDDHQLVEDGSRAVFYQRAHDSFISAMETVQEQFIGVVLTQFVIMDSSGQDAKPWIPEGSLHLPPEEQSNSTTTSTLMCDVVGRFLGELAGRAEQMKTWASVATPLLGINQLPRFESESRSNFHRRLSGLGPLSREGSPAGDGIARPPSRPASQAFRSPSPSVADSPRPDSPSGRSDTTSSPDRGSLAETPIATEFYKTRPKYASMNIDSKSAPRNIFPNVLNGSSPEKERNIGRARVGITLGTLYMMAGRWTDAWRELIEHTTRARSLNDYIWLATGVERLTICMLLLGSAGFPFQIPSLCLLGGGERQSALSFMDSNRDSAITIGPRDPAAANSALRKLGSSLSDIATTIMTYHDRAGMFAGEYLALVPFSELILRLAKLQAFVIAASGTATNDEVFCHGRLDALTRPAGAKGPPEVSRLVLCETLFRAFPGPFADLSTASRTSILAGMAAVLSSLNMERKRAIVLKELVTVVVPSLQQARKLGAAELGIHPSSSVSYANGMFLLSNQDVNTLSVQNLLLQLQAAYAVRESTSSIDDLNNEREREHVDFESVVDDIVSVITRAASLNDLGSFQLKYDILRASLEFCEALPDPSGVAQTAALLLKIAGPYSAVNPTRRENYVTLGNDEQIRLANLIMTVIGSAGERGVQIAEPSYWDRFLVRSVQLIEDDMTGKLIEHRNTDLSNGVQSGLFLHDAFAKKVEKQQQLNIVVAQEPALVAVVLQNPYDFDIEVESIDFVLDEGQLDVDQAQVMLGARRLQEVICLATAPNPGSLKIRGCKVKIAGCRPEVFPIYNDEWQSEQHVKVKEAVKASTVPRAIDRATASQVQKMPKSSEMAMMVIPAQPVVVVEKVGLKNQSLMLLEGERTSFNITLRNVSSSIDVDFLYVSFEDSLTNALRTSLASKSVSRMDLYEIELEMAQNPIFTWKRVDDGDGDVIKADSCATFEISVLGRAGIRDAKVLFDFANLGDNRDATTFYTRQLAVNINLSINMCIELQHFEIMRIGRADETTPDHEGKQNYGKETCLLVFDVRNAWPHPIQVDLEVEKAMTPMKGTGKYDVQSKTILSNQSARFALPIYRLFVGAPHAQVPWITAQSRRQFVVSTTGETPSQQRNLRELFWYREELLKHLQGSWREASTGRYGAIDLRVINLNHQHLEALRLDILDIQCNIKALNDNEDKTLTKRVGRSSFEVEPRQFLTFQINLTNRSDAGIHTMLRLLPMVANQGAESGPDMVSRKLVWSGILQRPVPMMAPGESRTVELGFCVLSAGMYNVGVVVEEIRPAIFHAESRPNGHENNHDDDDLDDTKKSPAAERRVWRMAEPCSVRARKRCIDGGA
ncbi:hypothetical protein ANO11243_041440 [Dothideomycetidae sp. 11243]|nr:hypothetical protein ANO11243_041440 [fungal sp. No.11243]